MHHAYRLSPVKKCEPTIFEKEHFSQRKRVCGCRAQARTHTQQAHTHTHTHTHCKRREKDEKERALAGNNILSPAKLYYRPQVERDKERKMTREKKTEIGFKS